MNIKTIRISTILLIIFLFTPITDYALSDVMDMDNDNIPDANEMKLGLDKNNPGDALDDMDNDGFTNVFEFQQGTNIKKAISHPPLYMRLHLLEFKKTLLPFRFMVVNINGDKKEPADWAIAVKLFQGRGGYRYKYLNSTIVLDKVRYTITKIDARHEEKRQGGSIVKLDKSKVYLKSKDGKYTITMQVGKDVFSPRPKAVIEDIGTGKMYQVGEGDTISMYLRTKAKLSSRGRRLKRKITKYKVLKVDWQKKQVIIEDKKRKKKYTVTAKAFMPRPNSVVIKPKLTKPVVIKSTVTQKQTQTRGDIPVTLKDMLYVNMFGTNYMTEHPLICIKGGDYPSGSEMIFIKQSNSKELVHAVFPKRTTAPKNMEKKIVLHGYFQNVQNIDNYKKRVSEDYEYFVVTSWEYSISK